MSEQSSIEWTDATWNPVRGCVKVSPGCTHCYAETFAERFRGVPGHPYEQGFDLRLVPEKLTEPLTWRKPRRVFVNSMSDLFQDGVPDSYIDRVFAVMALAPRHTFQILTKRAERMREYLCSHDVGLRWLLAIYRQHSGRPIVDDMAYQERDAVRWTREGLPNVWLGVSVENQHFADERIPLLLQTPAAVRFISAEPLLGPVTLAQFRGGTVTRDWLRGATRLDLVIAGGESGAGARERWLEWLRSLRQQCAAAGVAFFLKQLGANATANYYDTPTRDHLESTGAEWPDPIGWHEHDGQPALTDRVRLKLHKKGGLLDEWPPDLRIREFPKVGAAEA